MQFSRRDIGTHPGEGCVIVGLRRVGKSFMLYQIMSDIVKAGGTWQSFLYVNLEDDRLEQFTLADFDVLKQCYEEMYDTRPIFFLDEVQAINGWEKFVRRLADQKYSVYVTGSNAKMLSSELSSTLGGRLFEMAAYPLSFNEFLTLRGIELEPQAALTQASILSKIAVQYMEFGGMPEVALAAQSMKRMVISNQFNAIFFRDLVLRHRLRGDKALRTLFKKVAESVMQPQSFARLAHVVSSAGQKVKQETIAQYLSQMIESLIIFPLENIASSLSERTTTRKYYFIDNAFIQLFVMNPAAHLLENLVAITLHKKYQDEVMYYNSNVEVDFVVPSQGLAVQATIEMSDTSTFERECAALIKLAKWKPEVYNKLVIVTLSDERTVEISGHQINIFPLWKWLLN